MKLKVIFIINLEKDYSQVQEGEIFHFLTTYYIDNVIESGLKKVLLKTYIF